MHHSASMSYSSTKYHYHSISKSDNLLFDNLHWSFQILFVIKILALVFHNIKFGLLIDLRVSSCNKVIEFGFTEIFRLCQLTRRWRELAEEGIDKLKVGITSVSMTLKLASDWMSINVLSGRQWKWKVWLNLKLSFRQLFVHPEMNILSISWDFHLT